MRRTGVMMGLLALLLSAGWVIWGAKSAEPTAIAPVPPVRMETTGEKAALPTTEVSLRADSISPQVSSMAVTPRAERAAGEADLDAYTLSLKKEEKKGYQLAPGVTVKNKAVQVKLEEDNSRYVEISKDPPGTNAQYQVLVKKTF